MSKIALRSECTTHSSMKSDQCATLGWINFYALNQVESSYASDQCVALDDLRSVDYATELIDVGSNNSGAGGYAKNGNIYVQASNKSGGSGYIFPKFRITPIINAYSKPSGGGTSGALTADPSVTTTFSGSTLSMAYDRSSGSYPNVTLSGAEYYCACPIKCTWSTTVPTSPTYLGLLTIKWNYYYFSFLPANGPSITSPSDLTCSCYVYRVY